MLEFKVCGWKSSFVAACLLVGCGSSTPPTITDPDAATADDAADAALRADSATRDSMTGDGGTGADGDVGSDASSLPSPDVSASVKQADDALAAAVCGKLATCCSPANADLFFRQFEAKPYTLTKSPTPAECPAKISEQFEILHQKWASAVQRGTMSFDRSKADACAARMQSAACGTALVTTLFDGDCFGARPTTVFKKITPTGAACQDIADGTFYGECDPALGYCDGTKCVSWKKTGEPCGVKPREFCAPELECLGATPTKPGKCSAAPIQQPIGGRCDASDGPLQLCPADAYCDFVGDGTCKAKKADGAACAADDECVISRPFSCAPTGAGKCGDSKYCDGTAVSP